MTHKCRGGKIQLLMRGGAAVARRAHNPKVGSSNLPPATKKTGESQFCVLKASGSCVRFDFMYNQLRIFSGGSEQLLSGTSTYSQTGEEAESILSEVMHKHGFKTTSIE